jgi:outer membrane protein OmpA-like peptidoglycan-associated protein
MARLKELLFDSEAETLDELDKRLRAIEAAGEKLAGERILHLRQLEQLFDRVGTEEKFRTNVAVILDKALYDAGERNHKEMSRAIAPLVVTTIKTELKNSQDELVEIMHPITGRMVKAFVLAEMKKLSETVNSQIDKNPFMLRVRSLVTGKPVADLAIARSQRLVVDEIFLIRRGSGELLGHWPPSSTAMSNADVHMSGMLEAVNEFASSAFADEGGQFDSFRYQDFQVYMRASPVYLLAARCTGVAPSGIESIFDDEFLATIERVGVLEKTARGAITPAARSRELEPMASTVVDRTTDVYDEIDRSSLGGAIVKGLLFLIAVPLLTWFFWGLYTDAEEAIVRRSAQQVIAATPGLKGYQTGLEVGYRGKSLMVSGLTPDAATKGALEVALGRELPGTQINSQMAVLPNARVEVVRQTPVDTAAIERRLGQRVAAAQQEMTVAAVRRSIGRAQARLQQALPELDRLEAQLPEADKKADVREVRTALEKTIADIKMSNSRIVDSGGDAERTSELVAPINRSTQTIAGSIRSLVSISGLSGAGVVAAGPAAVTIVDAAEDVTSHAERLATLVLALNQTIALIPEPVQPAPVVVQAALTAEQQLRDFISRNAVFFVTGTNFVDGTSPVKVLDQVANLIKQTNDLVRIVGYTDEKGDAVKNDRLAQERADRVMQELVDRGVPPGRLVAIGRSGAFNLRPGAGEGSPNRRVQFELGFEGEVRGSP